MKYLVVGVEYLKAVSASLGAREVDVSEGSIGSKPKETGGAKRRRPGPLSRREREIFELLADGLSGAEIAERLTLSPETVRTHIRNAMAKLEATTRSQAIAIALRRREITPRDEPGSAGSSAPTNGAAARTAPRDLSGPLTSAIDGLLELWDVDAGWIFLAEDDGLSLRRVAHRVGRTVDDQPKTLSLGQGTLGRAALERRAQVVRGSGGGAMIVAPMLDDGRLVGVIALATRPSRATGRQELLLLQALAGRLAEVIRSGGPQLTAAVHAALSGFRASWTSASRQT
jgi:DNA-binding CsgD family transcriptional regulator